MSAQREGRIAALRGIANGLRDGMADIHAITVGGYGPITVQVNGDLAENVDRWIQYFDPAAKGAVTNPNWGAGKHYYSGQVVLEEGATVEFWDVLKVPTDDELRAENERLRAELAALRSTQDIAEGGGEAAGPVLVGPAAAPTFELGPVLDHDLDGPVELEHEHTGGAAGGPGENEVWCACGVTYAGFDTHAEAMAMLEAHIAEAGRDRDPAVEPDADGDLIAPVTDGQIDGALVDLATVLDAQPELLDDTPAVESDADALDQLGVAATDPSEVDRG
jgi:hypothetical protein